MTKVLSQILNGFFSTKQQTNKEQLQHSLRIIRSRLGMNLAFISRFSGSQREIHYVDSDRDFSGIVPGVSTPLAETYCQQVVDGTMPEMGGKQHVSNLPPDPIISLAIAEGAYLMVPIKLGDGTIYGTLCAIGTAADTLLSSRDLNMMHAFADIAAEQIDFESGNSRDRQAVCTQVQDVIDHPDQITILYQPIFDILDHLVIGYESLSRFSPQPTRAPDLWFADAAEVGLGAALEMAAVTKALQAIGHTSAEKYISVNASPINIGTGAFAHAVENIPPERVVLEITEHAIIKDHSEVMNACRALRNHGMRLAIDDAGSGYASFSHILSLQPDMIKLDISMIRAIDADSRRQALIAAFVAFADKTTCELIAEGVETAAELATLKSLGVSKAQGYLLGKPAPLSGMAASVERV